jgi:choline kinase
MLLGQGLASPQLSSQPKQYRTHLVTKRLSGRASVERMSPSVLNEAHSSLMDSGYLQQSGRPGLYRHNSGESSHGLLSQVTAWIEKEKSRRHARKQRGDAKETKEPNGEEIVEGEDQGSRRGSVSSDGSAALEELEQMVQKNLMFESKRSSYSSSRRYSSAKKLKPEALSSDTEYQDGDAVVPTCDAILDNAKVLGYDEEEDDGMDSESNPVDDSSKKTQDREARSTFKYEIVRLTHTLRLKGWRRVALESSDAIKFKRLSGALTNAVYVVSPPAESHLLSRTNSRKDDGTPSAPPRPVPRLLLRIYGPQVEHLIDREAELQILKRLARKKIGPRLLGTFANGRFEEFLNAEPLTSDELRTPETSKAIAKRMRELHDGIELLDRERNDGPFVWKNWEKWVERCQRIATWLDARVDEYRQMDEEQRKSIKGLNWVQRGYVCGTKWSMFRQVVERYRKLLDDKYGGPERIKEKLVFAHNDVWSPFPTQVSVFWVLKLTLTRRNTAISSASSHPVNLLCFCLPTGIGS